jgi:hypothetical protein
MGKQKELGATRKSIIGASLVAEGVKRRRLRPTTRIKKAVVADNGIQKEEEAPAWPSAAADNPRKMCSQCSLKYMFSFPAIFKTAEQLRCSCQLSPLFLAAIAACHAVTVCSCARGTA